MLKKIKWIVKRIIFAFLFIYAYNRLAISSNLAIPFNYITVILFVFFGVPSIFLIILFSIFCI